MDRNTLLTKIHQSSMIDGAVIRLHLAGGTHVAEVDSIIDTLIESGPNDMRYGFDEPRKIISAIGGRIPDTERCRKVDPEYFRGRFIFDNYTLFESSGTLYVDLSTGGPVSGPNLTIMRDVVNFFSQFGGNNHLLARVRAGEGEILPKGILLHNLSDGVYFRLPDEVGNDDVRRYFSKGFKPKDWREGYALQTISQLAEGKAHYSGVVNRDRLPQDLRQYFRQKLLDECIEQLRGRAEEGNKNRFEELGKVLLKYGSSSSCSSNEGKVVVLHTSTHINPYTSIVRLERILHDKVGKEVQLDYNDNIRLQR